MHFVTRLDIEKYSCVTDGITTDEVIITDERTAHIEEHHPGDWEKIKPFLSVAIDDPDFILDEGSPNTGLLLKYIEAKGKRLYAVLRLHTQTDNPEYKNSVLSAWIIGRRRWEQYLNNEKVLYSKE